MERWVFDLQSFPATWGAATTATGDQEKGPSTAVVQDLGVGPSAGAGGGGVAEAPPDDNNATAVNWTDVNESLRGALCKIAYAAEQSSPLPENCTFTLAVELRDQAPAPIGVSTGQSLVFFSVLVLLSVT
jgi:mitotic spindle assembly checkpoint protein MAD2B